MNIQLTRVLTLILTLAILTLAALSTAAMSLTPPSARSLAAPAKQVAGAPTKPFPTRGAIRATQLETLQPAAADVRWSSLRPIMAQYDQDARDFTVTSNIVVTSFTLATYGLVTPQIMHGDPLEQDSDSDSSTDPLGEGFKLWPFTVTADDLRLVIQARNSQIDDLDMYVMRDANNDGQFDIELELENWSWNWDAEEQVDLRLPEPGNYLLAIHAYLGSGAYDLKWHRITTADQNRSAWMTGVPASLAAGGQYTMQYQWDQPVDPDADYFGIVTLGTDEDPTAFGFERVDLVGNVPAVAKTTDRETAVVGDTISYTVTLTNAAQISRTIELSDTVPGNLAVLPGSLTGGATLAGGKVSWNGTLPGRGSSVQIAPASFPLGGYVSLASLGVKPLPVDSFLGGDDEQILLDDLPAFRYLGNEHTALCMMSNGYLVLDGCRVPFHDIPYIPFGLPLLPHAGAPHNMIAPLWTDLDLASDDDIGSGAWYTATVTHGQDKWLAFEWEDVQRYDEPDTAFTFQVWLKVGADQVFFVYERLDGSLDTSLVGAENDDGTAGASYYYNNGEGVVTGTVPQPGTVLRVTGQDPPRPTHTINYKARATAVGQAINIVEIASSTARDSASITTLISQGTVRKRVWLPIQVR